ncbi:aminotransferase class I/II-fold pyridoxal phosphate-dependent enzyme [Bacillus sp. CSS-39]|uniref:aminotransferase class I/II-fold pyridoxal phosphate-dependent enzyme n=1 Tax=Bacillus haimaensis TaxID=3160967 RepID=UPI003AA9C431
METFGILEVAEILNFKDYSNLLSVHSLSKFCCIPGARCGFICGDENIIEKYNIYRNLTGSIVPTIQQSMISIILKDSNYTNQLRD